MRYLKVGIKISSEITILESKKVWLAAGFQRGAFSGRVVGQYLNIKLGLQKYPRYVFSTDYFRCKSDVVYYDSIILAEIYTHPNC